MEIGAKSAAAETRPRPFAFGGGTTCSWLFPRIWGADERQEEVSSISRGLKGLAKELKVPVLVLSQLTRAPERDDRNRNFPTCANRGRSSKTPT